MKKFFNYCLIASSLWLASGNIAQALPGESIDAVTAWMRANPTLRATTGERLVLRRDQTPARRFTFQASIFPIGGYPQGAATASRDFNTIRNERFALVDTVDGVSQAQLEEVLRVLYGPDVYADYRRSQPIYIYPASSPETILRPSNELTRGEIRLGGQYAYWIELIPNPDGTVNTGSINVLLSEDLTSLQTHLQNLAHNL